MANIFQRRFSNNLVACLTTVAGATATLTPPQLMVAIFNRLRRQGIKSSPINYLEKLEKITFYAI